MSSRRFRVYLADLTYSNHLNRHTRHVPKNIGYIAAYARRRFGADVELSLFKTPEMLLAAVNATRPDLLGMSFYFWNTDLGRTVAGMVRAKCGPDLPIVWGGPSVDSDPTEQARLFSRFPDVDAFIPNEGELGFAAVLDRLLSGATDPWADPIEGAVHRRDGVLLRGAEVGLGLDLSQLPSPYLTGLLAPFLQGEYLPGIQTSRLCPYTCTFCVSGKNSGKLRAFPLDQVKEEITFIARTFADRPHLQLHINDENFGIVGQDAEIADHIVRCSETFGYPQSVFFYHDKRLTDTTRHLLVRLAKLSDNGVTIPLQTENPTALLAAKRKPVSAAQLADVVDWAAVNDLPVSTEMIFGLPGETADSFATSLDGAIMRGFDSVLCNTLFIVDGIEINRAAERERLGIVTRFRQVRENYGMIGDQFCAEVEEVVVSTDSFDLRAFLDIRKISMAFYACFNMRFHYWLISHLKHLHTSITGLMRDFLDPARAQGPQRDFAVAFEQAAIGELYESAEELRRNLKRLHAANGGTVGGSSQINIQFGARLIYREGSWTDEALLSHLSLPSAEDREICRFLIDLYRRERTDLTTLALPAPIETRWDVLAWRLEKFHKPLAMYRLPKPRLIGFSLKPNFKRKFDSFTKDAGRTPDTDYYVNALQVILPRSDLLLHLTYLD